MAHKTFVIIALPGKSVKSVENLFWIDQCNNSNFFNHNMWLCNILDSILFLHLLLYWNASFKRIKSTISVISSVLLQSIFSDPLRSDVIICLCKDQHSDNLWHSLTLSDLIIYSAFDVYSKFIILKFKKCLSIPLDPGDNCLRNILYLRY